MTMNADHWDPEHHERTYYRHVLTGDLGYLVRREGKDHIRLDRPAHEITRIFKPGDWIAEREYRPMTRQQFVQVAFEADKKLCALLGMHEASRREWLGMRDTERIRWIAEGPPQPGLRRVLFQSILKTLEAEAK